MPPSLAGAMMISHGNSASADDGQGYDWQKMRRQHLLYHPLCADCEARGVTKLAKDVDHVVPIAVDPSRALIQQVQGGVGSISTALRA